MDISFPDGSFKLNRTLVKKIINYDFSSVLVKFAISDVIFQAKSYALGLGLELKKAKVRLHARTLNFEISIVQLIHWCSFKGGRRVDSLPNI